MQAYADLPAARLARASRTVQDAATGMDLCRFCAASAEVVASWDGGRKFLTVCRSHAPIGDLYILCMRGMVEP